jgi:tellurite resistance protein TerC
VRFARRLIVAVVGGTVVAVGVAMLVLPGPALIVIPAGLALLATEFVWARRLLKRVKDKAAAIVPLSGTRPPTDGPDRGGARRDR